MSPEKKEKLKLSAWGKCERSQWEEYEKEYISTKTMRDVPDQYRARFDLQRFAWNYFKAKSFARSNWLCKC